MRSGVRFAIETMLLMLLAGGMIVAAITAAVCFIEDERIQYLAVGYYIAVHGNLVRWIWKKLGIEKATSK